MNLSVETGRPELREWLKETPIYASYTYSYPHKTSYRPFEEPHELARLWADEDRARLFLYVHVPFCVMRCGFCNLFTRTGGREATCSAYVDALERQARTVSRALGRASFARVAIGGGTPTVLGLSQLERVFDLIEGPMGASLLALPTSLETSPETASSDHLALARSRGVDRVSIGIQSFFDEELKALGRPLRGRAGIDALDRLRASGIPSLNLDLIYGIAGQTTSRWISSVRQALRWRPEELYLYPLYIRPLTGLGRRGPHEVDQRLECYRAGRDVLLSEGYEQISTRLFRRTDAPGSEGPEYACQEDGMVGLGCGARSYTRKVHYSEDWAVSASQVRAILAEWVVRDDVELGIARYGVELDALERKTRFMLKSIFHRSGLDALAYAAAFGSRPEDDWPELMELVEHGFLRQEGSVYSPTANGLERADQLGPWLYSTPVRRAMKDFELR